MSCVQFYYFHSRSFWGHLKITSLISLAFSLSLIDASICYSILLVCFRLEDNRVAGGQDLEEILGAALLSL
jgi:hypothetical protein